MPLLPDGAALDPFLSVKPASDDSISCKSEVKALQSTLVVNGDEMQFFFCTAHEIFDTLADQGLTFEHTLN